MLRTPQHSGRCPTSTCAYPGTIVEGALLDEELPESDSVVLYTHMMCPYAQRAWLVVLEKRVPHTLVHVDLSSKPAWFLRMNPRGQVPFAALQSDVQGESLDICRYGLCVRAPQQRAMCCCLQLRADVAYYSVC